MHHARSLKASARLHTCQGGILKDSSRGFCVEGDIGLQQQQKVCISTIAGHQRLTAQVAHNCSQHTCNTMRPPYSSVSYSFFRSVSSSLSA